MTELTPEQEAAKELVIRTTPKGQLIDSDETLIGYFLDEARVAAVHGAAFGLSPAFRISYATTDERLRQGCEILNSLV